jgi:hypothetical protein
MLRIASECISYNLEFQIFRERTPVLPTYQRGHNPPLGLSSYRIRKTIFIVLVRRHMDVI